jgi:acetyltransferase-like isoleucine patch superfamily enzyme
MIARIRRELSADIEFVVCWFPGGLGHRLRRWHFDRLFRRLGSGASIGAGLHVLGPENINIGRDFSCWRHCTLVACDGGWIEIGDRVALNANVYINAGLGGRIVLGNDVLIGPNAVLRASDHVLTSVERPINQQGHRGGRIVVEDDVWVGASAVILPGVCIGHGAVVGAGAVVRRDVPPYALALGNPATVVRNWRHAASQDSAGVSGGVEVPA